MNKTIIGNPTTTPMAIPDWNQTGTTKADYIKNKPEIANNLTTTVSGKALDAYQGKVINNIFDNLIEGGIDKYMEMLEEEPSFIPMVQLANQANFAYMAENAENAEYDNEDNHIATTYAKKADLNDLEGRLKYYGDANVVPTDVSLFAYEDNGDGTCTITRFDGTDVTDVVIPYEIDELTVTGFERYVFSNYPNMARFIMPDTIRELGEGFCGGCSNLIELRLSKNVSEIPYYALSDCGALEKLEIPKGITAISANVLMRCYELTEVVIPDSVEIIASTVSFTNCPKLTIICNQGSYAEKFAKDNAIPYKYDISSAVNKIEALEHYVPGVYSFSLNGSSTAIYSINTTEEDIAFEIEIPTDPTNFYQILIHADIATENVYIYWGTSTFFNGEIPSISKGKYDFIFEWDGTNWCAGAIEKGVIE